MFGIRWRSPGGSGYEIGLLSPAFEAFRNLPFETDVRDTGLRGTQQAHEGDGVHLRRRSRLAHGDRLRQAHSKQGNVKYWEWTEARRVEATGHRRHRRQPCGPNRLGAAYARDTWYLFVTEGEHGALDGLQNTDCQSTLKYFKSANAGKTSGPFRIPGVPAHAIFSSVSFARYGDNYHVFLSVGNDSYVYLRGNWKSGRSIPCTGPAWPRACP